MPVLQQYDFNPRFAYKNPHVSTFYPYFLRKFKNLPYSRQREELPDGDFIDIDWMHADSKNNLVVLLHGLEGSSESQYVRGSAELLFDQGWNVCAINHRSCSGVLNRNLEMYHSGFTKDLAFIIEKYSKIYQQILIVGFSLGGNMALKYLGEGSYIIPSQVKMAVAYSVPTDLEGGSLQLTQWYNKAYTFEFLKTLKSKMRLKATVFPQIDLSHLSKLKQLIDFDEYYTAYLHGFKDAKDYYRQCNSKQFLSNINHIPTFLINALDDPFLSASCHPFDIADASSYFHFIPLRYGG
ncbi:MAG TPA: alpha/beta fold hydrolase, partial [Saprospiraceae bacterium]|nr:alpha/beta fold hydrolase [Saprospiraceae bacterium]